jgi:PhzF family phenazine biosynthesis protein
MREYNYKKINAFTNPNSLGNPAACIYLNEEDVLSATDMLEIAKQHKGFVSEVVYCRESKTRELHLTYYSSECEVDFCGHGTIACMYSLIKNSLDLMKREEIPVRTNKKGEITVYNKIVEENAVYITAPDPVYGKIKVSTAETAKVLGIPAESISKSYPMELIDAGLKTFIIPINTLSDEVSMYPDIRELEAFCVANNIDIILVYSWEVQQKGFFAHTRVFAPKFGYLEDPATGSGNSAFGYYLLENHLWDGAPLAIEQGGIRMAYNTVKLCMDKSKVLFGGAATDCIVGKYYY